MTLDVLPEECIVHVLSCTSPRDACQSAVVSSMVRDAAESDVLWDKFLPNDYPQIISRLVSPLHFSSKKDLFLKLSSTPLLIDGGNKTFSLDKSRNKKCYMLCARALHITWSSNSLYWCWKPLLESRFAEVVELVMVCWLEIHGKINTCMLSPNTNYGAYLIVKFPNRAFGLDVLPSEVSVEVGDYKSQGTVYLRYNKNFNPDFEHAHFSHLNRIEALGSRVVTGKERLLRERGDRWLEIELGDFYNDGIDKEVKMGLREVRGEHLKGGIVVEGIEVRPK